MREAIVNGKLVPASPDAPDVATCPSCGGEVHKRKRHRMDGQATYYYRHTTGTDECPRRYNPTS